MKLSAVINTKNSASTLARCLESLSFADEIVVVDMHSTDDTREIAQKYNAKIFEYDDVGFVEPARNFAINKASHEWVIMLDTDEELPQALQNKIPALISMQQADIYLLPRKNLIFSNWVKEAGWWPDYQPRLFKKDKLRWNEAIHSRPDFFGSSYKLEPQEQNAIVHYHYQTLEQFISRLNRYTSIQAEQSPMPDRVTAADAVNRFNEELNQRLFSLGGIQSQHGTTLAFLQAMSELIVASKQWETHGFPPKKRPDETVTALEKMRQDLAYWLADYRVKSSRGFKKMYWQLRRKLKI